MMTDAEIIEVVTAHKEGKKIQYRWNLDPNADWKDMSTSEYSYGWNFHKWSYRVAPEPPKFLKGYCYARDIHDTGFMGMIKVEQIALDEGENPIQRKHREWRLEPTHNHDVSDIYEGDNLIVANLYNDEAEMVVTAHNKVL